MKILTLKFKNINSLAGENEIDFTNPVFTDNGLFVITGKTGSGKSSILDAISLAFFGKTARVDITQNDNAVLTKGEKDCYSEIIFEVAGKKWKSYWSQEINRNGNLNKINRKIADANDNIIADQVRSCDQKIIEILGLSFEQFTKVIMLAQGSFDAFLQADKNEKGQLLEQITGTEIYAAISQKVYERYKTEQKNLEKIEMELSSINLLSEQDISNLVDEITFLEKENKIVDEILQKSEIAKNWLVDLENSQKQLNEIKHLLPELEEKSTKAKENFNQAETTLKLVKEEQTKQDPVFKKVRELDTKIAEKERLLTPIVKTISELDKSQNELNKILNDQNIDLEKFKQLLTEKQNWAIEFKKYAVLVSNFAAIEKEHQLLAESSCEIKKLRSEIDDLQKDFDTKTRESQKNNDIFTEKEKKITVKNIELTSKKKELTSILKGKELSEFQKDKEKISNFENLLNQLVIYEKAILKNQENIKIFDKKISECRKLNIDFSEKIKIDTETEKNLEKQIDLLEDNIQLTKTIQSLEEHRKNLNDNEPCPLCGAKDHPFAQGNIPQIGENEKKLAVIKNHCQEINTEIQKNQQLIAKWQAEEDITVQNRANEEILLSNNFEKREEFLENIKIIETDFSIPMGIKKIDWLQQHIDVKKDNLRIISQIINSASDVNKQIIDLRDNIIPELQTELQKAEKNKNDAYLSQLLAKEKLEEKQKMANINQEKFKNESDFFSTKLNNYGVNTIEALKKCLEDWNNNQLLIQSLKEQIATLENDIKVNQTIINNNHNLLKSKYTEKQIVDAEQQTLKKERENAFREKSVDEEENRLKKLLEESEEKKMNAEKAKNDAFTEYEKNKAVILKKEKEFEELLKKNISNKTIQELDEEVQKNKKSSEEYLIKIGFNQQTLKANSENLKNSSKKIKEKEAQVIISGKWGNLNDLLGSSDGKKYRNFAQALTFEHLISLANIHLQKISDRYILKRIGDTSNPFELSVIDNFQNSDERTVQNLSGGEKFIVSLSLALGLANMASKNMQIDTMFIDEGFGTLDSDYLDVILNALSNLQSEGKLIGVISHLTELKERIATHIEVTPIGRGHSKIQISN